MWCPGTERHHAFGSVTVYPNTPIVLILWLAAPFLGFLTAFSHTHRVQTVLNHGISIQKQVLTDLFPREIRLKQLGFVKDSLHRRLFFVGSALTCLCLGARPAVDHGFVGQLVVYGMVNDGP